MYNNKMKIYSEKTDEELTELVKNSSDADAFGELVERYNYKLSRYASKFLYNIEDRKDVVQEVFIKAYRNIQSFNSSKRFSPWIYKIAHNEFVNALIKNKREKVSFFDMDIVFPNLASSLKTDDFAERKEQKKMVEECLEKLNAKYREVVVLYYIEGFSYEDISEILKIPKSTVGVRLSRAKERLKKYCDNSNKNYE